MERKRRKAENTLSGGQCPRRLSLTQMSHSHGAQYDVTCLYALLLSAVIPQLWHSICAGHIVRVKRLRIVRQCPPFLSEGIIAEQREPEQQRSLGAVASGACTQVLEAQPSATASPSENPHFQSRDLYIHTSTQHLAVTPSIVVALYSPSGRPGKGFGCRRCRHDRRHHRDCSGPS